MQFIVLTIAAVLLASVGANRLPRHHNDEEHTVEAHVMEIKPQQQQHVMADAVTKMPNVVKPVVAISEVIGDFIATNVKVPTAVQDTVDMMPAVVDVVQKTVDKSACDRECTKFEFTPICATNGICLHEFANQCVMDVFTCLHPHLNFKETKDDRCQMHWLKRCTAEELK